MAKRTIQFHCRRGGKSTAGTPLDVIDRLLLTLRWRLGTFRLPTKATQKRAPQGDRPTSPGGRKLSRMMCG